MRLPSCRFALSAILLPLFSLPSLSAQGGRSILVDIHGRPGAQFTQIQPAIDAAQSGDTLLLRSSLFGSSIRSYDAFVLDKGLAIIAIEAYVEGTGESAIRDIRADEKVLLRNFSMGTLKILRCKGLVVGDGISLIAPRDLAGSFDTTTLEITDCRDVRMRQFGMNNGGLTGRDGVRVRKSRFEVDGASIDGADGALGRRGGIGIWCQADSVVSVSFSRIRGGDAGAADLPGSPAILPGGAALVVDAGASLQVNGNIENELIGGWSGCPAVGAAVRVFENGAARISGELRISGGGAPAICGGGTEALIGAGEIQVADPADLALFFRGGLATVGVRAGIEVHGEPGALLVLLAGVEPAIQPLPGFLAQPLLLVPSAAFPLDVMPQSSELFLPLVLPPGLPPGLLLLMQAVSLRRDGRLFLSNSTVAVTGG